MLRALLTIVVLAAFVMRPVEAGAASAGASDKASHAGPAAKGNHAAPSDKASHATPAAKTSHVSPAPATTHTAPASTKAEAANPVAKPATHAELVAVSERIQQRVSEVTKAHRATGALSNKSSSAKAPAPSERTARVEWSSLAERITRVRLVWRIELTWPDELGTSH